MNARATQFTDLSGARARLRVLVKDLQATPQPWPNRRGTPVRVRLDVAIRPAVWPTPHLPRSWLGV